MEIDIPNVATALKTGSINGFVFYTFKHALLEKNEISWMCKLTATWSILLV